MVWTTCPTPEWPSPGGLFPTCPTELGEASASACWVIMRGVAGADEHWGADLHHVVARGRMHHPRVFKAAVMENWPGPFLLDPGPPSEGGRIGCLASGGGGHQDRFFVWDDGRPLFSLGGVLR